MAGAFPSRHIPVRKHSPSVGPDRHLQVDQTLTDRQYPVEIALSRRSELRRQVRNQDPIPQVQCLQIHQARVPLFPGSGCNVALQARKLRIDIANFREGGNALPNDRIKVRTRSFPIRTEETVATIFRNRDGYRFEWSKYLLVACDFGKM
jgi:hypothetical protein